MKFKRTIFLTAIVIALGVLLGASTARAAEIEKDGDTATAIRGLELGNTIYDVFFTTSRTAAEIWPLPNPPLDFLNESDARAAVQAVDTVLREDGEVRFVGDAIGSLDFLVPYDVFEEEPGQQNPKEVTVVSALVGENTDPGGSNAWDDRGSTAVPYLQDASYADFVFVDTLGSGNQAPTAEAGGPYEADLGAAITFDGSQSFDRDGTIVTYAWDFGDSTTGSGETTSHTYATAGTYNVILTVTDDAGVPASDSTTAEITDAANVFPVANASYDRQGTAGEPVNFDGSSSYDHDGTIVAWDWDFGDGEVGSGETPSHTYSEAGTYDVTLTVTDNDGATDDDTAEATIGNGALPPQADAGAPVQGVVGEPVNFDGTGSTGENLEYDWNYGDSTFEDDAGPTPSHTYATADNYTVTLRVTDLSGFGDNATTAADIAASNQPPVAEANGPYTGAVGVPIDFDSTGSSDPDGGIASYAWEFDDDASSTEANPSHAYDTAGNYNVTLTVTDGDGATAVDYATADVDADNQSPVADANGPYPGVIGSPVTFDGTGSDDPDGSLVAMVWDFGDESTGTGPTPSHTYTVAGSYDVTLTVTDNDSATDQHATKAIIASGNLPPVAEAGGPYTGAVGTPVIFDGTGSSDPGPGGSISSYAWNFGDETEPGSGSTPSHTYSAGGVYNVTLSVVDEDGASASDLATAIIGSNSQPPTADAGGPYGGSVGVAVNFTSMGTSDPDGDVIVDYDWNFGDDTPIVSGENPIHIYSAPGQYDVTLTVTDITGESDTDSTNALIAVGNLPPKADAGPAVVTVIGQEVSFDGRGSFDLAGTIETYDWNFGDETTGTGATPTHTYADVDSYNVTLTVTDDAGATDSDSTVARIVTEDINVPPVKPSLNFPADGSNVDLEGKSSLKLKWLRSKDPNGDVVSYRVHVCFDSDPLTNCPSTVVASLNPFGQGKVLYASVLPVDISKKSDWRTIALMGVLSCIVLMGFAWKYRHPLLMLMLLIFSVAIIVNCGDSGGGGGGGGGGDDEATFLATGLSPDKRYCWSVVAEDDQGESSDSDVWCFTTK